jgi:hypothetical protein
MAGFNGGKVMKKKAPGSMEMHEIKPIHKDGKDGGISSFAKNLASGEKQVRDATFAMLTKWQGEPPVPCPARLPAVAAAALSLTLPKLSPLVASNMLSLS